MGEKVACYYIKKTQQKDGLWFWADEVYFGRELEEAGFSVEELLEDYIIKAVYPPPDPSEVNTPAYYLYPQEEYERDLAEAERILKEEHSDEPPFYWEGFIAGYIQEKVKYKIKRNERTSPINLGLSSDFKYTEEMFKDDLKAVELYKEDEKENKSDRHSNNINNTPEWKAEAAKRMLKDNIADDKVTYYLNISSSELNRIRKDESKK